MQSTGAAQLGPTTHHRSAVSVGPIEKRWPGVHRIAVLRGGGLGDVICTLPALEALAAAYPQADIVLMAEPGQIELFKDRPSPVTSVAALPRTRGIYDRHGFPPDDSESERFFDQLTSKPIDLAVQLHGGGRWSNPFIHRLNARWTVGTRTQEAANLTRWIPYRVHQHEILRWLEVVGLAGASPVALQPRITVTAAEVSTAHAMLGGRRGPRIAVHPGASDPRRRWPAENFGEVIARCVQRGAQVLLIGSAEERTLLEKVSAAAQDRLPQANAEAVAILDPVDLSVLCGVLELVDLLIGNDSGVRHLATAIGKPTVGIFWVGNAFNAGPLGRYQDRALISWVTTCPVCEIDCTRIDLPRCEHDVSFVATVSAEEVMDEIDQLMRWRLTVGG